MACQGKSLKALLHKANSKGIELEQIPTNMENIGGFIPAF
jgi:hypothetical protein